VFIKSLTSSTLLPNKKIATSDMVSPSLPAAIFGWIWFFGSVFFQLLKPVVPGAAFAKDFGFRPDFRVAVGSLRIKDDAVALELEIMGFVFVIGVFDEKIQAAAYGALHRFTPLVDKTEIRITKSES
jgi:hypothetical protein